MSIHRSEILYHFRINFDKRSSMMAKDLSRGGKKKERVVKSDHEIPD